MSLSNMNKDVVTRLFSMLSTNEDLSSIKADHSAYAKLTLLATQMQMLNDQALIIIEESRMNKKLQEIQTTFKKVPGTMYYLYTQNSKHVLSIINPAEWDMYEEYHGCFLYDFDHTFKKV
mgnify:CR=1 FL=1